MRQYLNENVTINEICLELRHPTGKNYLWVLVEGTTDQNLYAKLIDGANTKVEMVHGGGINNLRKALEILIIESDRIIRIRDADFLHINQQDEIIDTLFLTDAHDAEMTLLSCDTVFQHLVAEYLPSKYAEFNQLRDSLLVSLAFLSGIRWLNDTEELNLNFNGIGMVKFYDQLNLILDKTQCLQYIESRSPNKIRTIPIQVEEIETKISDVDDYYNLNNGHDVVKAFALHIAKINGKGVKDDELCKALRIAYRKEDFAQTRLYRNLKNWEQQTGYLLFQL